MQSIGSIWFGGWGAIASALFPLISNSLSGSAPLPVSIAYIPGNLAQGIVAAIEFSMFKSYTALRTAKDWIVWILLGVLLSNAIGAIWGTGVLVAFGLVTGAAAPGTVVGWFIGNSIPSIILGSIILKFVSPLVLRSKAFCKGWWA